MFASPAFESIRLFLLGVFLVVRCGSGSIWFLANDFWLGWAGFGRGGLFLQLHNVDDDGVWLCVSVRAFGQFQITDMDCLAQLQSRDSELNRIWNLVGEAVDGQLVQRLFQDTTGQNAWCGSSQLDGNSDVNSFVGVDSQQVDVADFLTENVPLNFADNGLVLLTGQVQIHDVST